MNRLWNLGPGRLWTLRRGDVGRALIGLLGATVGIMLASWLLPGFEVRGWAMAAVTAVLIAVFSVLLRPVLVFLAVVLGWVGAILLGLFGQAFVVWVVVELTSGTTTDRFTGSFAAAWIITGFSTLFVWLATAGTDDAVTASLLRRARRSRTRLDDPELPGIVFVQVDGLPFPVLDWGVRAGTLPTLSRWIRDGDHHMAEWRPKLPATTPASQMGILHGSIEGIPAFRWVERSTGQVLVANKPADAATIEARHSDGRGLLADDGVSVSNLFTGDARTAYAVMSAVGRTQENTAVRLAVSRFLARPSGLARGLSRTISEIVRERFQARRARRRDIRPRVHRGWNFTIERAALLGVLRDLNTWLVAESMLAGRRSIYVDYVDYDAVAHHAGVMQPESLSALEGIDSVLGQLEEIARVAPRPYHIVVLSDHGQSQGATFADRYGEDLAGVVRRLAGADVVAAVENLEGGGHLTSALTGASGPDTALGRTLTRASERLAAQTYEAADAAAETEERAAAGAAASDETFLVFGSGNLGLIFVAGSDHRLDLDELTTRFPALVPGLVAHPGVAFAVVDTAEFGPVAIGPDGEHRLRDGEVVGEDPLTRFGPHAQEFLLRAATMEEAPDIYVNSTIDDLDEVAAFEGLVGCHGGLGGWQDRASLIWPDALPAPTGMIVGADAMYRQLVSWLEGLGHRGDLPARSTPASQTGASPTASRAGSPTTTT